MSALILWIGGSILVAVLGRHTAVGPWGFLLFSLVFSPIVGLISLLVAGGERKPAHTQVRTSDMARLFTAVHQLQLKAREQEEELTALRDELSLARAALAREREHAGSVASL